MFSVLPLSLDPRPQDRYLDSMIQLYSKLQILLCDKPSDPKEDTSRANIFGYSEGKTNSIKMWFSPLSQICYESSVTTNPASKGKGWQSLAILNVWIGFTSLPEVASEMAKTASRTSAKEQQKRSSAELNQERNWMPETEDSRSDTMEELKEARLVSFRSQLSHW